MIRDLQELWLFGGLDTLSDSKDEEQSLKRAVAVAEKIEVLAKSRASGGGGKEQEGGDGGVVVKEEKNDG